MYVNETLNESMEVIDAIAKRLSVPASQLFDAIQYIGIRDLVFSFSVLILIAICITITIFCYKKRWFNYLPFTIGLPIFFYVLYMSKFSDAILWLYSPKSWAVKYIAKQLKIIN